MALPLHLSAECWQQVARQSPVARGHHLLGTEPHAHLQLQIRQKVRQMQNSFENLQFLPCHGDDVEVKMDIQITQFIRLVQVPLSFLASAKQLKTPPLF